MKKKNEIKKNKLSIDKFKIAEIKNLRIIVGGILPEDDDTGGTGGGNKIPPM